MKFLKNNRSFDCNVVSVIGIEYKKKKKKEKKKEKEESKKY